MRQTEGAAPTFRSRRRVSATGAHDPRGRRRRAHGGARFARESRELAAWRKILWTCGGSGAGRTASMMGSTISSVDILCRRSKADGRAGSPTKLAKTRARGDMCLSPVCPIRHGDASVGRSVGAAADLSHLSFLALSCMDFQSVFFFFERNFLCCVHQGFLVLPDPRMSDDSNPSDWVPCRAQFCRAALRLRAAGENSGGRGGSGGGTSRISALAGARFVRHSP